MKFIKHKQIKKWFVLRHVLLFSVFIAMVCGFFGAASLVVAFYHPQKLIVQNETTSTKKHADVISTPTASKPPVIPTPKLTPKTILSKYHPIPVLMYHHIRVFTNKKDGPNYWTSVSPELFTQQMDALKKAGYQTITPSEYLNGQYNKHSIIITFDDGNENNYTAALPVLKSNGFKAVFYIISNNIGAPEYLTKDQLIELSAEGMTIGAHTVSHLDLTKVSEDDAVNQIINSKSAIETMVGRSITDFCFPFGGYNDHLTDLVKNAGFTNATTTKNPPSFGFNNNFEIPRLAVTVKDKPQTLLGRVRLVESMPQIGKVLK